MQRWGLVCALAGAGSAAWGADYNGPAFRVTFTAINGGSFSYTSADQQPWFSGNGEWDFSDLNIEATVKDLGNGDWQLTVRNIFPVTGFKITEVVFPWHVQQQPLDSNSSDDIVYVAALAGIAIRADSLQQWAWAGAGVYPGEDFSPFVIVADKQRARITAAINWPPKPVRPMVSLNRQILVYPHEAVGYQQSATYRCMIRNLPPDPLSGAAPWMRAVDLYRAWLAPRLEQSGLAPVPYPDWMRHAHGFLNVQLEDVHENQWPWVKQLWSTYRDRLPWVQFWGQMSCYWGGMPFIPPDCYACCALDQSLHPRYQTPEFNLLGFLTEQVAAGYRVGFYTRPWDGYLLSAPLPLPGSPTNLTWWTDWIHITRNVWGANAVFLDTVGGLYFGDPLIVANVLNHPRYSDSVIEGVVDIYPTAYLASGVLHAPAEGTDKLGAPGGPQYTVDSLGKPNPSDPNTTIDRVPFPQLANYLLNDRIFINGHSNTGWQVSGAANQYWSERQNFLLGWRFDVLTPYESPADITVPNKIMQQVFNMRDATHWYARRPAYLDRLEVSGVPGGVDVRRFRDVNGDDLLVVDNWNLLCGVTFKFKGVTLPVPRKPLSVIDLAPIACSGDFNSDGKVDQSDLAVMMAAFGSCEGDPLWDPALNLVVDGQPIQCIDQPDLAVLLAAFGQFCNALLN